MRNKYSGICYRCGEIVNPGSGHFELIGNRFRVQHANCAIKYRGQPDKERLEETEKQKRARVAKWERIAQDTGKAARNARRKLRELKKMNKIKIPPLFSLTVEESEALNKTRVDIDNGSDIYICTALKNYLSIIDQMILSRKICDAIGCYTLNEWSNHASERDLRLIRLAWIDALLEKYESETKGI